jgi:lysine N6-hydroxylase
MKLKKSKATANSKVYDILGIGIGPFNLGLAALADKIEKLNCIFFDKQKEFNWHAGMLLDNARLQVPYYADLVTLADPTSPFSYLNYLHVHQRIIPLGINEKYFAPRKEYNEYCRWVASQLSNLFFGMECESLRYHKSSKIYSVRIRDVASGSTLAYRAKKLVIGVGNVPNIPECALPFLSDHIIHSANYLFAKEKLLVKRKITIVGSGQSAAEIFYDILQQPETFDQLFMFTRAADFFPMDYSRFALEKTTPDYIDYFFLLSNDKKKEVLSRQNALYKGINFSLITDIHDALDAVRLTHPFEKIGLVTCSELKNISLFPDNAIKMNFYHDEMEKEFIHSTEAVILATGYKYIIPEFLQPVKELVRFNGDGLYDVQKNYSIDCNNSIFVQNAELHTHGFNAPDLGMGPYRNAIILNTILGNEYFKIEKNSAFQTFGIPKED